MLIENNDEMLSKATKNEAPTSGKHEVKKPPYSPVFRYVVRSNDLHRNMQGAFSQRAYYLLAKFGYDFSAPSRLNKLNPELTEEKIHELTKAQHKLRNQGFHVDQPRIGLGGSIKVKQHVSRKLHDSSDNSNEEEVEIIVGSNHVSIDEGSDSDISADGIQNAPLQLEDGVQATIDELKELNLGTIEEPAPIFISALLSLEEEEQYFKTLGEYKDVFAWTSKEILS
ncbi:UNVERIFIED_CONTAM: hypothetical protein Scaly_1505300 [Sesamum calycinum]|uniref:Uncharacterized protein n=1 Tax=Sesamum calycinum TaxID=2727403 RepID=A0AAW2PU22_9LAMI